MEIVPNLHTAKQWPKTSSPTHYYCVLLAPAKGTTKAVFFTLERFFFLHVPLRRLFYQKNASIAPCTVAKKRSFQGREVASNCRDFETYMEKRRDDTFMAVNYGELLESSLSVSVPFRSHLCVG